MKTRKLEIFANVTAAVLCVVVCGVLVQRYMLATPQPPPEPPPVVEVAAGDAVSLPVETVIDADSETAFETQTLLDGEPTLLFALQPGCESCTRSLDFYRTLVEYRDKIAARTRIVALVPRVDQLAPAREVLDEAEIHPDALMATDFRRLRIPGTPTVLLVDDGRAEGVWSGLLQAEEEKEVIRSLSNEVIARRKDRPGTT